MLLRVQPPEVDNNFDINSVCNFKKRKCHQPKNSKTLTLKDKFKEPKTITNSYFNLMNLKQWKVNENEELDFLSLRLLMK